MGLFGSQTVVLGAGLSNAGRPRLPFRLMVSLLYLKHAYNESDEGLVERWSETWDCRNASELFAHRQTSNRVQPSEIKPDKHSLDLNELFQYD